MKTMLNNRKVGRKRKSEGRFSCLVFSFFFSNFTSNFGLLSAVSRLTTGHDRVVSANQIANLTKGSAIRMKSLLWLTALLGLNCSQSIDPASLRLAGRQDLEIALDDNLTTPTLLRGQLADLSNVKKENRPEPLLLFFTENAELFKLLAPDSELRLLRSDEDELGFVHYRYARLHRGVPIYGDELIVHVDDKARLYMVNGSYHPSIVKDDSEAGAEPSNQAASSDSILSAQQATDLALEKGSSHKMQAVDSVELVYYPVDKNLSLAWYVTLKGGMNKWDYFIDAHDGRVLFEQDRRRF